VNNFQEMCERVLSSPPLQVAVAKAEDSEVLLAVKEALRLNLAGFQLIGDELKIRQLAEEISLPLDKLIIVNESSDEAACRTAVRSVSNGKAHILMKGLVPTATILKAVLDKEIGLRTGRVLSHVAVFEVAGYERLVFLTDAAMNIAPDLQQKQQIIQNAVDLAISFGINLPKVAVLAALEKVNPQMSATVDAALLSKMAERGQINNAIIDGPLALDNAISIEAAQHKGISGEVAGLADILLVPTIEVGNALYKSLVYFAKAQVGAVITGAKAPIVLTSRADTYETKLNSLVLAVLSAQHNINNNSKQGEL